MNELPVSKRQAELLVADGRYAEAEQLLARVLDEHADEGHLWRLQGVARHALGNFGLAAMALEHAGMLVPMSANDQILLADCYIKTNREKHAQQIYQHLFDDPRTPRELLPTLAAGFGRVGNCRSAMKCCHRASQEEPHRPEPLFGLVFYLRKLGYPAKVAIPVMRRAFEMATGTMLYRSTLAFLLAEDGRTEDAYDLLCDVRPDQAGCQCQLRRMMGIYQAVGDFSRWEACRARLDEQG